MSALVTAEPRTSFVAVVHGKRRKFWTRPAAYYAVAKAALLAKYRDLDDPGVWLRTCGSCGGTGVVYTGDFSNGRAGFGDNTCDCERRRPAWAEMEPEMLAVRIGRYRALFCAEDPDMGWHFRPDRWSVYVRRVAKRLRMRDARKAGAR